MCPQTMVIPSRVRHVMVLKNSKQEEKTACYIGEGGLGGRERGKSSFRWDSAVD